MVSKRFFAIIIQNWKFIADLATERSWMDREQNSAILQYFTIQLLIANLNSKLEAKAWFEWLASYRPLSLFFSITDE